MNEKRWKIYHNYEKKQKKQFLRKLSEKEGFRILTELYRFTHDSPRSLKFNISDMDKINILARVHYIFGKVKA